MAHDVFISYATEDKVTADAVCARLEQNGIRCWVAPRDVVPGANWKASIVTAIRDARALVLVFSAHSNASTEVPKEVDQAVKNGISIVTFRIEDVPASPQLEYELRGRHWLDALTRPMERHIDLLVTTLRALLDRPASTLAGATVVAPPARRVSAGVGALVLVAVVAAGLLGWWATRNSSSDAGERQTVANTEAPAPNLAPSAKVIGCWQMPGAPGIFVVRADGTFVSGGVINGTWKAATQPGGSYAFQFPEETGQGQVSADGRRLTNPALPNDPLTRVSGTGIVGVWRFSTGQTLTVERDGTAKMLLLNGRWQEVDRARRLYQFYWPAPQPTITVSPDGSSLKYVDSLRGIVVDLQRLPC